MEQPRHEYGRHVRVVTATNQSGEWNIAPDQPHPVIGKLVATQTLRPGVVSFALGFGHWATGAHDVTIDRTVIKGEKRRQAGIHGNAAMWTDPDDHNTCMFDPIGGSVCFYNSHVRLEPI